MSSRKPASLRGGTLPESGPSDAPTTLVEALHFAAKRFPERGLALYDNRGRGTERRAWPEVLGLAQRGAERLRGLGLGRHEGEGDAVLVCLPTGWAWMETWLGALLAGAQPVAIAPAGAMGSSDGHTLRLAGVRRRLGGRRVVAPASLRDSALELAHRLAESDGSLDRQAREEQQERLRDLRDLAAAVLTPEDLEAAPRGALPETSPKPDDIAFLQLTSGSTGLPRAVRIPHRAALHNGLASDHAIGAPFGRPASGWADAMVCWLPLHHDMGLVGCLFLSLTRGLDLWLMNPTTFLARPQVWLQGLSQRGVTFAPAPNFGYQLCVERLADADLAGLDLDLSGFRAALTGAEMVRPETTDAFTEIFAPHGFRPEAFRPCYGLAEGTLAVTFDERGAGVRTTPLPEGAQAGLGLTEVVSVGVPIADTEVHITAPDGTLLREGDVGEVRVRGPGIFAGYHGDPEATARGLVDGWLLTGDLGFVRDGELHLTGRTKDVLILRGHNLMPHELEWLAEEVTGGGGAQRSGAFSIAQGAQGEVPVLVVETAERSAEGRAALDHDIRQRIGRALGLPLADLVFVRRGRIPKTTSGKVQRRHLRQQYLEGALERLD